MDVFWLFDGCRLLGYGYTQYSDPSNVDCPHVLSCPWAMLYREQHHLSHSQSLRVRRGSHSGGRASDFGVDGKGMRM